MNFMKNFPRGGCVILGAEFIIPKGVNFLKDWPLESNLK